MSVNSIKQEKVPFDLEEEASEITAEPPKYSLDLDFMAPPASSILHSSLTMDHETEEMALKSMKLEKYGDDLIKEEIDLIPKQEKISFDLEKKDDSESPSEPGKAASSVGFMATATSSILQTVLDESNYLVKTRASSEIKPDLEDSKEKFHLSTKSFETIKKKSNIRNYRTSGKPYSCKHCSKKFLQNSALKKHLVTHSGGKPYHCTHCSKGFTKEYNLQIHLRIHTGEKPYTCKVCFQGYSVLSRLKIHMLTHSGEKPFKCTYCSKGFRRNPALQEHIRIHTGEKPYKCDQCSKSFTQTSSLQSHLLTHTDDRKYLCTNCPKKFKLEANLQSHLLTHNVGKPYACAYCNKTFVRKPWLDLHITTHTGVEAESAAPCQEKVGCS